MLCRNYLAQIVSFLLIEFCLIILTEGEPYYGTKITERKQALRLALLEYNKGEEKVYCTATAISPQWLVTNRRCFQTGTETGQIFLNALSSDDKEAEHFSFSEVYTRVDYTELEGINDVALVKTKMRMDDVHPIEYARLMDKEWPADLRYNRSCETYHYLPDPNNNNLATLYTDTVLAETGPSSCQCLRFNIKTRPPLSKFQKVAICGASIEGDPSCYTYSAAPLFCDGELVGVGHMVVDCESPVLEAGDNLAVCQKEKILNTYTGLFYYVKWMKAQGVTFPKFQRKSNGQYVLPEKFYTSLFCLLIIVNYFQNK